VNALRRLLRGDNNYDFVRSWKYGLAASAVAVLLSLVALFGRGLALGLDFEGGTSWEVPTSSVSVSEARDVLRPLGQADSKIQTVGSDTLRVQSAATDVETVDKVRVALAEKAAVTPDKVAVTTVGPSWGNEISKKAIRALVLFFVAIALYITFALRDWRMAVGALVAVAHDILISVGVYSLLQIEVTPATVIAFLTILGFSLYDTVVVYARIRENSPMVSVAGRMTYTHMASLSLNQVLMRSINTSLTAVLPVMSMLVVGSFIFGATTLEEFAIALLVGLFIGAYSSIFIAAPVVVWLKEREPRNVALRERLAKVAVTPSGTELDDEPSARRTPVPAGATAGASTAAIYVHSANHPPRPRKKTKATRGSHERRLAAKHHRSLAKRSRRVPGGE
jgi:preprotein translocase subunit SecF